jgi:hypothetical protein
MALDGERATAIMKRALLRDLGDKVDLIFRYGSQTTGATHEYSDIDMSYVPAHESTWHSITVLVDDVLIDLYPLHWSRLERLATFDEAISTVVLQAQVVYERSDAAAERFRGLKAKLRALQEPEARPEMLRKAQGIFERTGYQHYLLRQQVSAENQVACLHHARNILQGVLHAVAVANQACVDTRKLEPMLALPRLPSGLADAASEIVGATDPDGLLPACEKLLATTRDFLLAEQEQALQTETTFRDVFEKTYPEFRADIQHQMLACKRQDLFALNLTSLYHELMVHTARAQTGTEY